MKIGLIGLPKSGKTTLFNLLTGSKVATARYDTGRAELHTGIARVPDPRVDRLSAIFKPKKTTYATFEVVDLAGIERGERAGLDTKEFRNADALLHVIRAFADACLRNGAPRISKREAAFCGCSLSIPLPGGKYGGLPRTRSNCSSATNVSGERRSARRIS